MSDNIAEGTVTEILPNNIYAVTLDSTREIKCYLSGKMRMNHIRVLVGDRVKVLLDPYKGVATNRITERLKQE